MQRLLYNSYTFVQCLWEKSSHLCKYIFICQQSWHLLAIPPLQSSHLSPPLLYYLTHAFPLRTLLLPHYPPLHSVLLFPDMGVPSHHVLPSLVGDTNIRPGIGTVHSPQVLPHKLRQLPAGAIHPLQPAPAKLSSQGEALGPGPSLVLEPLGPGWSRGHRSHWSRKIGIQALVVVPVRVRHKSIVAPGQGRSLMIVVERAGIRSLESPSAPGDQV